MKKLLLVLFISFGLIGSANAVSSPNDFYTSTCTAEQSTGFTWENYDWKKVTFKPGEKYEVIKVDPANLDNPFICEQSLDKDNIYKYYYDSDNTLSQFGCYSIKTLGAEDYGRRNDCREWWTTYPKEDGELIPKTKQLNSVSCRAYDFNFSPDGWFHTGNVNIQTEDIVEYKDSLFVEIGKCSTGNFTSAFDSPSLDSEWQELDKKDDGETFYLALDSIKKVDGFINYWYMRDYADNEIMGPIRSEKILVQGDCSVQRINHLSHHVFKKPKGIDIEMSFDNEPPEWQYVKPGTFGGWLLNLNCSLEERMGSMSSIERKEFIEQIKKL